MNYVIDLGNVPTEALLDELLDRDYGFLRGCDLVLDLLVERGLLKYEDENDPGLYRKL